MERLPAPVKCWDYSERKHLYVDKVTLHHPSDVAFIGNDILVTCDSEAHKIVLMDIENDNHNAIGEGRVWPNGVATTNDGKIVVTDRKDKQVKIFDMRGDLLMRIEPRITDDWEFHPHGVAVNSIGQLIVTDTARQLVYIFSQLGKEIHKFGTSGHLLQELTLPFYCAADSRDNIFVSDNRNFAIKQFDSRGGFVSAIGSGQDWGERRFQCPYGVACDLHGNVILADHGNDSVRVLDQSGEYFTYVAARTRGDDCEGPVGVAASADGKVAFTEVTADRVNVKVYKCF